MKVPETHKDIHGNGIKYQFEKWLFSKWFWNSYAAIWRKEIESTSFIKCHDQLYMCQIFKRKRWEYKSKKEKMANFFTTLKWRKPS